MAQGREGGQPRQLLDLVNLANPANHTPRGDTTQGAREPGYLYASFPGTSCLLGGGGASPQAQRCRYWQLGGLVAS